MSTKVLFLCSSDLNRPTGTPIRVNITVMEMARRLPCHLIAPGNRSLGNMGLKEIWTSVAEPSSKIGHLRFLPQALYHLAREQPTVIHTFSSIGMLAAHWYKQLKPAVKLIFEMHGVAEYETRYASRLARVVYIWMDKIAVAAADWILAMSTPHKQFLVDVYKVPARKVEVSWGPVDLRLFSYRPPSNRKGPVIGYAGNDWFWQKGISYLFHDVRDIPIRDAYYDTIACLSTLEHIGCDNALYTGDEAHRECKPEDFVLAMQELCRVLKLGGRLFLTVPFGIYRHFGTRQQFDQKLLARAIEAFGKESLLSVTFYRYTAEGWNVADAADCAECEYVEWIARTRDQWPDPLPVEPDLAAAARAVACVRLIKE